MPRGRKAKSKRANASPVEKSAGEATPPSEKKIRQISFSRRNDGYGLIRKGYGSYPSGYPERGIKPVKK